MSDRYERSIVSEVRARLDAGPPLIQMVVGPRQVGKTTAASMIAERWPGPSRYAAADGPSQPGPEWLESHWHLARRDAERGRALLVLDEVQKVRGWSEAVKRLWDEDRRAGAGVSVLLLGSSALLLARGATESLAGRFFLQRCLHWGFPECARAFGWGLDEWLYFGGYPGAARLAGDEGAWRSYVVDSLVETALSRDVIAVQAIAKPALMRHLFGLAARFPAQILSYNKMLGQLHDAGNATTLAHYVRLLETAFLLSGLEQFSAGSGRRRGSSPKLVLWSNALVTALAGSTFAATRADGAAWGRLVENAVGAHLIAGLAGTGAEISYFRERGDEVDYVVRFGRALWAIEVKSGAAGRKRGLDRFRGRHPEARALVLGGDGVALVEAFATPPRELLAAR